MTDNAGYRPTDDSALRWEDCHCTKCGQPDKKCECVALTPGTKPTLPSNERLRTALQLLVHRASEELGGFHSLVTLAEEILDMVPAHETCEQSITRQTLESWALVASDPDKYGEKDWAETFRRALGRSSEKAEGGGT